MMRLLDAAFFKREEPLKPVDFMNFIDKPPEKQLTAEQVSAIFKGMLGVKRGA